MNEWCMSRQWFQASSIISEHFSHYQSTRMMITTNGSSPFKLMDTPSGGYTSIALSIDGQLRVAANLWKSQMSLMIGPMLLIQSPANNGPSFNHRIHLTGCCRTPMAMPRLRLHITPPDKNT